MDRRRSLLSANNAFDINNYLTIEALEDGLTASLSINACEYCVDGDNDNWKSLTAGTATESINAGQTLSFRGNLVPTSNGIGKFTVNKGFNLKGNVMSMLFGDDAKNKYSLNGKDYAFKQLFRDCVTLKTVSKNFLPAITLAEQCYYNLFQNCTSLTTVPELPATTLTYRCYIGMFRGCTNLTTAPVLHANILVQECYATMFYQCSKLNYIKMLATDISAVNCFANWVSNVASSGVLVKNSTMTTLPTGNSGVPSGWTVVNDGDVFIINLVDKYEVEYGMTWEEWINSKYNIDGFTIKNGVVYYPDGRHYVGHSNYTTVSITEIISSTENYYCLGGGNGSGD